MTHTKSIKKIAGDFEVRIDGEVLCYTSTMIEAIEAADQHITALVELEARTVEAEPVAEVAPVAAGLMNITRENVARVVAKAKEVAAEHVKWQTALSRAESELCKNNWLFTGSVLKIHSRTRKITYVISGNSCTCEAHTRHSTPAPCWHVAAWRILIRAAAQPAA